jgi:hypothetical protein
MHSPQLDGQVPGKTLKSQLSRMLDVMLTKHALELAHGFSMPRVGMRHSLLKNKDSLQ